MITKFKMTSPEIRQAFLDFFQQRGHLIVQSAPLVAKNDPTLMFNNSGMAQFKDFFLGNGTPPRSRIADTQKCLRVSGKHNDLEDVGFDTYHHTMFEMLGNWSFGDYFKKEALAWSWELLTEVYKLPKERIYVSVFGGDETDGVPFDQEAFDLWKGIIGDDSRIILGNKKDNFWEMGEVGPCGPCSEIHIDLRNADEVAATPGKDLVNADHPQVVEIWNNVFMQFERKADGSLVNLPAKHVDTGMGFERLCMAIQGKQSNYDTDVFRHTIEVLEELSGIKYQASTQMTDVALRVIADHIRAVAFTIADGQLPSNAKAGYVIRRILRRAVRYGYSYLGFQAPFMTKLVPVLAEQFKDVFPELYAQRDFVGKVIEEEELSFLRTLALGLKRLDVLFANLEQSKNTIIDGDTVFELNDTFGFPADLTALIAREKGFTTDEAGFQTALQAQKARSRKDAEKSATDWIELNETTGNASEFVGYTQHQADAKVVKYRKVTTKNGEEYHVVLDKTPFYAEMGGQVGDTGHLSINNGQLSVQIVDCKKENDLFIHVTKDEEFVEKMQQTVQITAHIDRHRRQLIEANHSVTHLMLAALRRVVGGHIVQKGSFQNEDVTRFDFSHFSKVTSAELLQVEAIVNQKIRENIAQNTLVDVPINDAIQLGATATFGEKYGDFVRVVTFDPTFSVELCGGTHVASTGQIGLFKFVSEGSVSAGVRRVEAVTGERALATINNDLKIIDGISDLFKGQKDLVKAVEQLMAEKTTLQKRIDQLENEKLSSLKDQLLGQIVVNNGQNVLVASVTVPNADALKSLIYQLRDAAQNLAVVLGTEFGGKPQLAVMIPENLQAKGLHAGNIVKELARHIKGGGGGQAFFATAGGNDASGLQAALDQGALLLAGV